MHKIGMYFVFQKMHYEHFQEAGVIYSTFNLKYNHKMSSIRRHDHLLYREATLFIQCLLGHGRSSSAQFALLIRVNEQVNDGVATGITDGNIREI